MHLPSNYLPIGIQALVALGFVILTIGVVPFLGPKRRSRKKTKTLNAVFPPKGTPVFPFR